jgi:hypothetical protein
MLESSLYCRPAPADADVDELFATYDTMLQDFADNLVKPTTVRHRRGRLATVLPFDKTVRRLEHRSSSLGGRSSTVDCCNASAIPTLRANKEECWECRLHEHESSPL